MLRASSSTALAPRERRQGRGIVEGVVGLRRDEGRVRAQQRQVGDEGPVAAAR